MEQADGNIMFQHSDNVADTPSIAFEIDPVILIAAYKNQRQGGPVVRGCFHSHPSGLVEPSATDARAAIVDGWIWIIIAEGQVFGWETSAQGPLHGRFSPVAIITDDHGKA